MATFLLHTYKKKDIDYKSSNKKYKLNRLFREYPRHSLWSKCRGVVVYTPRHTDGISQNKTRVRSRHDRHSGKIRVFNVALFLVFPIVWCACLQKVKLIANIFLKKVQLFTPKKVIFVKGFGYNAPRRRAYTRLYCLTYNPTTAP